MGRAAARLDRTSKQLRSLPQEGARSSVKIAKPILERELRQDAGADSKLSGVRNGVAQTVEVKVENRMAGGFAQARAKAGPQRQRAPWFWLDEGTEPGARSARRTRNTGVKRTRGGGQHPGTPPKRTWSRALAQVGPAVRKNFEQLFSKAVNS